jgi:hypothetical protein
MRGKARLTIDVSSTIMKNAAPVATAGIQWMKDLAERGVDTDWAAVPGAAPSSNISLTVSLQDLV